MFPIKICRNKGLRIQHHLLFKLTSKAKILGRKWSSMYCSTEEPHPSSRGSAQGLMREAALGFILKRSKIVFLGHAAPGQVQASQGPGVRRQEAGL